MKKKKKIFHFDFSSLQNTSMPNDTIVMVAVRFTYVLKDFESTISRQVLPRDESGMPILSDLPFGSLFDPVRSETRKRNKIRKGKFLFLAVCICRARGRSSPRNW